MKNNRKISTRLLALYALCAVLWSIVAIMKAVGGSTGFDLGLPLFCAVVWTGLAAASFRIYRKQQNQGTDNGKGE